MRIILICLVFSSLAAAELLVDRVITSVAGEAITEQELRDFAGSQGKALPSKLVQNDQQTARVLQDLIFSRLLEQEAARLNVSVGSAEVDSYIMAVRRQNGINTEERFQQELKRQGFTLDGYKQQVRLELLRARVLSAVTQKKVHVGDDEVEEQLEEPSSDELVLIQYSIPEAKFNKRVDVKSYAEKKELGAVNPEDLKEEVFRALSKVQPGELSQPVRIGENLVFYEKQAGGVEAELERQRLRIKERLFKSRQQEAVNKYLSEDLPERYNIKTYL